jgi:stage II sporulation protein E
LGSLELPIYQRKSDFTNKESKKSSFFVTLNSIPYMNLTLSLIAFLFGRATILDGLTPFGFVYFALFLYQVKKKITGVSRLLFIFSGVAIGYMVQLEFLAAKYIISMAILVIASNYLDDCKPLKYSLLAGLSVFLCQIPEIVLSSSTANIILVTSEALIIFLITLLSLRILPDFLIYLENKSQKNIMILIFAIIVSALSIGGLPVEEIASINLVRVASIYLIMVIALTAGTSLATIVGVLLGFFYSISHLDSTPLIGSYALAALIAGSFKKQKKLGIILGFILSNIIYLIFINEAISIMVLLKEVLIASGLLLVTPNSLLPALNLLVDDKYRGLRLEERKLQSFISNRMEEFSDIFTELSSSFVELGVTEQEEVKNIGSFLDLLTDKVCSKCDLYNSCWNNSFYKTYNSLFDLLLIAENRGKVTVDDLTNIMTISCSRKIKLATAINEFVKMYELNNYWRSRLESSERILLDQLVGMSQVIDKLSKEFKVEIRTEDEIENKIYSILENNGFMIKEVLATNYNNEELEFTIRKNSCNGESTCAKKMIPLLNSKLDLNLEMIWNECGAELGKRSCICQLAPGANYQFKYGVATLSSNPDVSGDNYTFFKQRNGKFISILSDGMGVGAKASQESGTAVNLLQKMLQAGLDYESSLHIVNSALGLRSHEDSFATVDLFNVDQATGQAEFVKVGSASSFIKRGSDISMIKSTSLPIGILNKVDIEPNSLQLQDKDLIIMMTDGVLDSNHHLTIKEEWVLRILKNNLINDPQSLAQYILDKAQSENDRLKDDMTVLVIRVDKC